VIEFQTDEAVAPAIASTYLEAGIPLIAIDVPHPGATYFGANNYQAGLLAGRYLGQWAKSHWHGRVEEVLLLELARAGSLVRGAHGRVRWPGSVKACTRPSEPAPVVSIDCDGQFKTAPREGSQAHPALQGPLRGGRGRERSERARRHAGLSGSRPGGHLCGRRAQRGARRPGGAARAANAIRGFGRLLSRSDTETA
jgi:hypothetical protein